MLQPLRVLVIDDDPQVRTTVRRLLVHLGHRVVEASSAEEGLEQLAEIDCVILDLQLPEMSGQEALGIIAQRAPDVRVIVASGMGMEEYPRQQAGLRVGVLPKPFSLADLRAAIEQV